MSNYRPKYKTGPQGNQVVDYAAEHEEYSLEGELHATVEDRRFNDDPVEFLLKMRREESWGSPARPKLAPIAPEASGDSAAAGLGDYVPAASPSIYYETRNGQLAFEVHP